MTGQRSQSQDHNVKNQSSWSARHKGHERNPSDTLSRFYKPSFCKDPWEPLLKQCSFNGGSRSLGNSNMSPVSGEPLPVTRAGLVPAVISSAGNSIADLIEMTMEEHFLTGDEPVTEQDDGLSDRPWH
ncbi:hypothetical protein CEUSTIGMA_g4092.t1 [Chlamydomonas eustigma]|uniref:Uncharacterized protein n=1 Tax=Chlamydomonas eustigma TaxID=1157962 RepID=A0A250X0R7_9CHLO|nr:hypothetical protein CEUSTIGMA_g4092.t1 [Chlamydomonas eustigma]|eukprot:GAX76646.1 hypothetical protein CEUSTIGMA_g4092.t1 [Chlamydomonas eustigma]